MRMSPKNNISLMEFATCFAFCSLSTLTTLPSFSLTMGPSIESQTDNAVAFPGLSSFNWVPIATYLSNACIVAGFMQLEDIPEFLLLPYLNLKPPALNGCVKTGLPATRSSIYVNIGLSFFSFWPFDLYFFCIWISSSRKFQFSSPKSLPHFDSWTHSLGAFWVKHSPITKQAPDLILF